MLEAKDAGKIWSLSFALRLCVLAMVCLGCARTAPRPQGRVHLALPLERQVAAHLCGIASAGMVAGFYGLSLNAASLERLRAEALASQGISGASLKRAFEEAGYRVVVFSGTLGRQETGLYRQLDLGHPLIIMTGKGPRHYCVVTGYDQAEGSIELLDPARGPLQEAEGDLQVEWAEANAFTLLAVPAVQKPSNP